MPMEGVEWNLFLDNLPADLKEVMKGAEPSRVLVDQLERTWKLFLRTNRLLADHDLTMVAASFRTQFDFLKKVQIIQQPRDASSLEQVIEERREEIEKHCFGQRVPKALSWQIEPERITLQTWDQKTYENLLQSGTGEKISYFLYKEYSVRILVRVYFSDQSHSLISPQVFIHNDQTVEHLEEAAPPARKKVRRKVEFKDKPSLALDQVEEGILGAVVEGEIFLKNFFTLKNGRIIATYYLTDYRNSLLLKMFLDEPGQDSVQVGDYIKAAGSVRYDAYAKEVALYLDDFKVIEKPDREDLAEEKRIELHAHTSMSAMDGLTDTAALIGKALKWGHPAVAITDHGGVQAFPLAQHAAKGKDIKILYGVEGYLIEQDKKERPYHIILFAQNKAGLKNLYDLISLSYIEYFYRKPKIPREELAKRREGLLLGSACEAGELFQALLKGASDEELESIVAFYDYLEIQPLCNNTFLVKNGHLPNETALEDLTKRIVELGKRYGKPVVATGDVHFLDPWHESFRTIVQAGQGYKDVENTAPLYFRTTGEMLEEFAFLGEADARWTVVTCPNLIAGQIERIEPIPQGFFPPVIETAEQEIIELTWNTAAAIYGNPLPEVVRKRIQHELDSITKHDFSVLYLIARRLVKKSNEDGYLVGSRGSVGSSLVAFLMGITEVNSLQPHYFCKHCRYFELVDNLECRCGVDLPPKNCPECGNKLEQYGFDIPFETFLGFEGDKVPDIDLNFSGDYQAKAHQYVEEIFDKSNVFRAGTISTIAEKTAYGFVKNYCEEQNLILKNSELTRLAMGITGVRRTTGQHPGGIIVVPKGHSITEFTPIQYPADKKEAGIITTHFEYHAMEDQLVKLDILGHDDPTVIRALEDMTGISAQTIALNDPEPMALFSGLGSLGVTADQILSNIGTYGVPEFGTAFVRKMLEVTRPKTFSELICISGLSHGTDVWSNNAEELIRQQVTTLQEAICTRDDIMTFLIAQGIAAKQSFDIMERVRKGKGLTADNIALLQAAGIPDWYIHSCNKIKYMFPKAHAVAYVTMAFRIAWYKIHYPLAFYSSFFSIRAEDAFEAETVLAGYDVIKERIQEIYRMNYAASARDKKIAAVLEVALEMLARGFCFYPVDIYNSDAKQYLPKADGLLLPFAALPSMGETACASLVNARNERPFISIEDFQNRSRVNKTVMEILRSSGCFDSWPETNQIDLFA